MASGRNTVAPVEVEAGRVTGSMRVDGVDEGRWSMRVDGVDGR